MTRATSVLTCHAAAKSFQFSERAIEVCHTLRYFAHAVSCCLAFCNILLVDILLRDNFQVSKETQNCYLCFPSHKQTNQGKQSHRHHRLSKIFC